MRYLLQYVDRNDFDAGPDFEEFSTETVAIQRFIELVSKFHYDIELWKVEVPGEQDQKLMASSPVAK